MWSNERSTMNVTILVGSRPFRLHVKNKWLEASVEALVARVLAKHGGGLAVEDCCVTVGGAAASGRAADVLREGGVVEVWRARVVVCTMVTASFCRVFCVFRAQGGRPAMRCVAACSQASARE